MKSEYKLKVLKQISNNLSLFNGDYHNKFLCPSCLKTVDLNNLKQITKAHIIPESSGGKLFTWLCKSCNSLFGENQDRWFSEYINIKNSNYLLSDKSTKHTIYYDGIKVNGNISQDKNGIQFIIDQKRNSPETLNKVLSRYRGNFDLGINMPILSKSNDIDLGYITAAYLYCFNKFGYSWILQKQLNKLREAMLNNDLSSFENINISKIDQNDPYDAICFGFAHFDKEYLPIVKVIDHIVFLPPAYNQKLPNKIKSIDGKFNLKITMIDGLKDKNYSIPYGMTISNKLIFYPNHKICTKPIDNLLLIDDESFEFILLNKTNNYNRKKLTPEDKVISIKIN